jgi:hypothetical protein
MTKKYDKLNDAFNVSGEIISTEKEIISSEIEKTESSPSEASIEDIKKDYEYARGNLYSLIEKGQEAINGILELAQESEMPRAYEVAGQLIKNTGEIAIKGPTTVNNALFVGSTADLAKFLKQQTQNENV